MDFGEGVPGSGGKGVLGAQITQGPESSFQQPGGMAMNGNPFKGLLASANLGAILDLQSTSIAKVTTPVGLINADATIKSTALFSAGRR